MKNFARALRFAWPYRWRFIGSVSCALMAALFWSLNFTAIYPVLKIFSSDQNLQEWVDSAIHKIQSEQITPTEKQIEELTEQLKLLEKETDRERKEARHRGITRDLAKYESRVVGFRQEVYRLQWMKKFIDSILPRDKFQTLVFVMLMLILAVAIKGVFEFGQETLVGNVVFLSLFDLRNRFFRRVMNQDINHFSSSADYLSRFTNDVDVVGSGMKTLLGRVVAEPLKAIGCIIFACWISWQLTFMFLVLVPVAGFVLTSVGRMMKRATKRVLEHMSRINQILQESFQGIRIIKAFGREPSQRRKFHEATRDYYHRNMRVVTLDAISGPIIEIMGAVTIISAVLAGAYLVINRRTHLFGVRMCASPLEMESLLQLYALLAAVADPVRKLSSVYTKIQGGFAGADRIFKIMDRQPKIVHLHDGPIVPRHKESIEFENVCFSYEPGQPVLSNVSLRIPHGQVVALVGKNGSGKSTLLNLLPRFFDPDHGAIYVDGIDIRSANLRSLRKQVGIVTQDTFLFAETVFKNIAFGKPTATPQEVENAARLAQAHDFILALPEGYETNLNELGQKLSGGQRQKIALARAILADPSILILDEFTSAADAESELELHRILKGFVKGRTCFVITHRLNTLEIADRIVVLDEHRVIAEGSHNELIKSCPLYVRLHEAHFHRKVA